MADQFFTQQLSTDCARKLAIVTPSDSNDLANFAVRGLLVAVTTAGTLTIDPVDGATTQNLGTLPVGLWRLPIQVRRVRATGTTLAGAITALY